MGNYHTRELAALANYTASEVLENGGNHEKAKAAAKKAVEDAQK